MRTTKFFSVAFATLLGFGASAAMADPCSASNYINGATAQYLNTTNVTINTDDATNCYGHVLNTALPGPGNSLASVVSYANTNLLFSGGWTGILRADSASANGDYSGLNFAVTGLDFSVNDMVFTLTITDNDPLNLPSVPLTMDLLFTLKSSTETDFYFFDNLDLTASNNGTYQMAIRNKPNNNFQELSDITLMGRDITNDPVCVPGTPGCGPSRVPEPTSALLVGLALAAAGVVSRRRRI